MKIRLRRTGAKKKPSYRLVVADSKKSRAGRYIESLGTYDPTSEPPDVQVEEVKLFEWMRKGAQPSDTVLDLLSRFGLLQKWEMIKRGQDVSTWERPEPRKSRSARKAEIAPAAEKREVPISEPMVAPKAVEQVIPRKDAGAKEGRGEKAAPEKKLEKPELKKEKKKAAAQATSEKELSEEKRKKASPPKSS